MEDQGKRIVLFVVIAGAIFLGWSLLFPAEKPATKPVVTAPGAPTVQSPTWTAGSGTGSPGSAAPAAGTGSGTAAPTPAVAPPPVETLAPEETLELANDRLALTLSSRGGTVKRIRRLNDPVKGGRVNDDLFVAPGERLGLLPVSFVNSTYPLTPTAAWRGEKLSGTKARYTYDAGGLTLSKDIELLPDDWMVRVTIDVKVAGAASQRMALSMFGSAPTTPGQRPWPNKPMAKCDLGGSVSTISAKYVARGPWTRTGPVRFFGTATPYFMFGVSPRAGNELYDCNVYPVPDHKDAVQIDLVYPELKIPAGESVRRELIAYFGPSYLDRFEHANEVAGWKTGFTDTVDFGWFSFIARPLLWLLRHIYDFVGNWGIAIILLTVLVKLATLYWTTKSMRSMKAMAALKPEMEKLQEKYKDDRQKLQQAQMDLFKRNGVNPLSGCLPMLLQMPIWMGLYRMLSNAGELHQAVFIPGWLDDLTLRDPYYILPVALTGLMFLQSKLQPMTTTDNTQQKILMYGMPLMFGVMGLWFPAGLTVYITTNTILGLLHTIYMKRSGDPPPKAVATKTEGKASESTAAKGESKAKAEPKAAPAAEAADDLDADADGGAADGDDEGDEGDEAPAPTAKTQAPSKSRGSRSKRRGKRR